MNYLMNGLEVTAAVTGIYFAFDGVRALYLTKKLERTVRYIGREGMRFYMFCHQPVNFGGPITKKVWENKEKGYPLPEGLSIINPGHVYLSGEEGSFVDEHGIVR